MSTQNLKFIHLANRATAQYSDANVGAIIFEPKSGRIAVNGTLGLEYYGGGRIADAKFENSKLTLLFNDGSDAIELDFSDTASASGVNAILKGLRTDVDALETTVNGDGTDGSGLVAKVAKNTTDIAKNASDIAAINAAGTGILDRAKEYTDGELTTLKGGYTGNLQALRNDIDSNDTDITNLQALHASDGATGKMTVKAEIDAKVGAEITGTVQKYVEDKVSTINGTTTELAGRVETLEGTVNGKDTESGHVKGLVKKVADLEGLHASGAHNGYSTVAEEAAAEVAKVVAGAPESLDTLKEIADWIGNDTTGAVQMANDIKNLKDTVGKPAAGSDDATGLHKDIADNTAAIAANAGNIETNTNNIKANADAIDALEALHAPGKKVADEVTAGIKKLGTVTETNDKGNPKTADVVVSVTTTEGKVSAVAVDASVLDGKVTAEVTRATNAEEGLRNDLGTKLETEGNAFTRIKALEAAQSSGSLMWSVWDEVSPV